MTALATDVTDPNKDILNWWSSSRELDIAQECTRCTSYSATVVTQSTPKLTTTLPS